MTTQRVEEIKDLIQEEKNSRTKAEGRLEDVKTRLQDEFDIKDIDGANQELTALTKDVETLTKKEKKLETEIEALVEAMEGDEDDED